MKFQYHLINCSFFSTESQFGSGKEYWCQASLGKNLVVTLQWVRLLQGCTHDNDGDDDAEDDDDDDQEEEEEDEEDGEVEDFSPS